MTSCRGTLFVLLSALLALALAEGTAEAASPHARGKKQAYGAIAYQPARGAVGYSYDFKSAREAKIEALRQCGDPECEIALTLHNSCGALARGPGKPYAASGATRDEAETKARRACGQKSCEIVAWACTR